MAAVSQACANELMCVPVAYLKSELPRSVRTRFHFSSRYYGVVQKFYFLLVAPLLSCSSAPRPVFPEQILSRSEFAYVRLWGRDVLCAAAFFRPCGLSLRLCSSGLKYECATDVVVLSVEQSAELGK